METCTGIVLKVTAYTDTQKIVHLYTREKGYLSMIAPSAIFKRKSKPVHLLQIAEVAYMENERGGLHRLQSAESAVNLPELYFDVIKMNIVLLWGEILNILLKNEGKNEAVFDLVVQSAEYLNTSEGDTGNFNLFFLYRLAAPLGFRIDTETWREGYLFNAGDGCFYPADGRMPCISGPNTARIVHRLCTCEVKELRAIPLNRAARNILLDVILAFFRIHLNTDFNIKSIRVIREIFA